MKKIFSSEILSITVVFLASRIIMLGRDIINVDAPAWDYRATQFYAYLKNFNFAETYRVYHPGVTLMWLSGFGIEVFNQIYKFLYGVRAPYYDSDVFPYLHFSQKFPLVVASLVLIIIFYKLLLNLLAAKLAFLVTLALVLEPFFVANTRVLHLDGLMTLFMLVSITALLVFYLCRESKAYLFLSSVCVGLAALTKITAILVLPFDLLLILVFEVLSKDRIGVRVFNVIFNSFYLIVVAAGTFFALFPAMWVKPMDVVRKIVVDGVIGTGQGGQGQYFLGKSSGDPGPLFYIYTVAFRLSPLVLSGALVSGGFFIAQLIAKPKGFIQRYKVLIVFLAFSLLYFAQMSYSSKKIDRYALPIIPFVVLFSVWGLYDLYLKKIKARYIVSVLILQFVILSVPLFPDYFNYANPLLGGLKESLKVFGPMDWGAGYYKVAVFLNNYDDVNARTTLAAYNEQSIAPFFEGVSVQIDQADLSSANYVILPPNDNYRSEILKSKYSYRLVKTINYGPVSYWYIYENESSGK